MKAGTDYIHWYRGITHNPQWLNQLHEASSDGDKE
jgi:hypothetical protein